MGTLTTAENFTDKEAASKRLHRFLERIRRHFKKRGALASSLRLLASFGYQLASRVRGRMWLRRPDAFDNGGLVVKVIHREIAPLAIGVALLLTVQFDN